jgi:hypothetical protein
MSLTIKTLFALCLISLTGCASLGEPERPDAAGMATLELPGSLDLVSVNGSAVKVGLPRTNPYFYTLAPGRYTIEVGYAEYWGSQLSGELVRSDIQKVELALTPDTVYSFQHTDPGTKQLVNQARFKNDFSVSVLNQGTGQSTTAAFSRSYGGLLGLLKGGSAPASQTESASQPVPVSQSESEAETETGQSVEVEQAEALEKLKYWWQLASKKQRGEFLLWSTENN